MQAIEASSLEGRSKTTACPGDSATKIPIHDSDIEQLRFLALNLEGKHDVGSLYRSSRIPQGKASGGSSARRRFLN